MTGMAGLSSAFSKVFEGTFHGNCSGGLRRGRHRDGKRAGRVWGLQDEAEHLWLCQEVSHQPCQMVRARGKEGGQWKEVGRLKPICNPYTWEQDAALIFAAGTVYSHVGTATLASGLPGAVRPWLVQGKVSYSSSMSGNVPLVISHFLWQDLFFLWMQTSKDLQSLWRYYFSLQTVTNFLLLKKKQPGWTIRRAFPLLSLPMCWIDSGWLLDTHPAAPSLTLLNRAERK